MTPLLSIYIPTFNRANMLKSAIFSLIPQIKKTGDLVELIISDNYSTDHTQQVVEWGKQHIPIRYFKNPRNMGFTYNLIKPISENALGEFGWIIGDDDIVIETAVNVILNIIRSNETFDYFFVNNVSMEYNNQTGELTTAKDFPEWTTVICDDLTNQSVKYWEEIITFSKIEALFSSMVQHIFRLSKWRENTHIISDQEIYQAEKTPFYSFSTTFPHSCIIAKMMIGKPAFYIGAPQIIQLGGHQEWDSLWGALLIAQVLELSDYFEELGAIKKYIDMYRNLIFRASSRIFYNLWTTPDSPGREYVSIKSLVWRYWKYPRFWEMVFSIPASIMKKQISQIFTNS